MPEALISQCQQKNQKRGVSCRDGKRCLVRRRFEEQKSAVTGGTKKTKKGERVCGKKKGSCPYEKENAAHHLSQKKMVLRENKAASWRRKEARNKSRGPSEKKRCRFNLNHGSVSLEGNARRGGRLAATISGQSLKRERKRTEHRGKGVARMRKKGDRKREQL